MGGRMMKLRMDFIGEAGPCRQATHLLIILGALASVGALYEQHSALADLRELEWQLGAESITADSPEISSGPDGAEQRVHEIARALRFPWIESLDALHRLTPAGVSITTVAPSEAGELHVSGNAREGAAVLDYVARLRGDAAWREVRLLSEEYGDARNASVRFSISVRPEPVL